METACSFHLNLLDFVTCLEVNVIYTIFVQILSRLLLIPESSVLIFLSLSLL